MSDASAINTFSFAFSVTAPIFLMVLIGMALKRLRMITEEFIDTASKLVFNLGLPTLLFTSSATTDFSRLADMNLLVAMSLMTLTVFTLTQLTARWHVQQTRDEGVFVQGAFRGNLVITGLAFCANAYGEQGLAIAALPVAMTVVLYNLLSVYTLNRSLNQGNGKTWHKTWRGILRNPLILAIVAGFAFNGLGVGLPRVILDSANYLGQMVLPLALICIGGALDLKQLRRIDQAAFMATLWKLILSPLLACAIAIGLGTRGESLAIIFLLAASPSATVSFVMVQAMGGNGKLAANIIVQTTLMAMISVTAGLWLLQWSGLV